MDQKRVNELTKTLKSVSERHQTQQFNNDVLLEFVDSHRNDVLPQMLRSLEHFDEMSNANIAKNSRPAIIASKGRVSTSHSRVFSSNDDSVNVNMSNISLRDHQRKKDKMSSTSSGGSSSDASFGGSPLKLECFADLSSMDTAFKSSDNKQTEKRFVGLDLQEAIRLISMYTLSCKSCVDIQDIFPSLWVLCNPCKPVSSRCVVMLAAEPLKKSSELKHANKSLRLTKVTMATKPTEAVDCHTLPFTSSKMFDIVCQAKYDMMEIPRHFNEALTVLVEWKNPSRLLEQFPAYATVTVFACIISGFALSPVHNVYVELMMLKNIINAMDSGDIVWIVGDRDVPFIEAVHNLIEHIKLNDDVDDGDTSDEPLPDILHPVDRLDLDFTDKLWKVLLACSSMSDLVESLQYVFTCLKNGEIQPFIHSRNETTLAKLVRDSYRNEMRIPALKGILPLTIMAEIAIEKLQNDYIMLFLSKGLVPLSSLSFYVNRNLDFKLKFELLEKLHYVVEMMLAMNVFLPLDQSVMGLIVKQLLHHFENNHILEGQTFEFSLPTGSVLSVLANRMPCVWKAELDGDLTSNMCLLSTSQPFCQLQGTAEVAVEKSEESESKIKRPYYMVIKQENVV